MNFGKITKALVKTMAASSGYRPVVSQATSSNIEVNLTEKQQTIVRDQIGKEIEKLNNYGFDIRDINELLAWSLSSNSIPASLEESKKISHMHSMLHQSDSDLLFYCLHPEMIGNGIVQQNPNEAKSMVKQVIDAEIKSNNDALNFLNEQNIAPPSSAISSTSAICSALGSMPATSNVSGVSNNNNIETPTGDVEDDVLAIQEANSRRNEQTSAPRPPGSN